MQARTRILDAMLLKVVFRLTHNLAGALAVGFLTLSPNASAKDTNPQIKCEASRIQRHLEQFTSRVHPFGSQNQHEYAGQIAKHLLGAKFSVHIENFEAMAPDAAKVVASTPWNRAKGGTNLLSKVYGSNVIAIKKGNSECGILIGSHFDTKKLASTEFQGANDGGSSTALLLEIAEVLGKVSHSNVSSTGKRSSQCSIVLAFFDGEESVLNEWNEGEAITGYRDNLYGSRNFTSKLQSKNNRYLYRDIPINLVVILDMVGHKKQRLWITNGSDEEKSQKIISLSKNFEVEIEMAREQSVEDDHTPFQLLKIPFIHIIDWTNTREWHTSKDTLEIISTEKIANLGNLVLKFIHETLPNQFNKI